MRRIVFHLFFSSIRRHTRLVSDWSSDVCSSDLAATAVMFNAASASFTVTSATAIQATVPAGATTGPLSVTTPGGTATSTRNFTLIPAPTITSFTPTSGPLGTSVTISGTDFTGATAVTFNAVSASFTVTSATPFQSPGRPGGAAGPVRVS